MIIPQHILVALKLKGVTHTCGNCRRWEKGLCSIGDYFKGTRNKKEEDSCDSFWPRMFPKEKSTMKKPCTIGCHTCARMLQEEARKSHRRNQEALKKCVTSLVSFEDLMIESNKTLKHIFLGMAAILLLSLLCMPLDLWMVIPSLLLVWVLGGILYTGHKCRSMQERRRYINSLLVAERLRKSERG